MKIHTTQNLSSLVKNQQATNCVSSKDLRTENYSEKMLVPNLSASTDHYSHSVSFGKKRPNMNDLKKVMKGAKKIVGDIAKEPHPKEKAGDKIIENRFFNWILSKHSHEPIIQAGAAGLICTILRPTTIMAMPAKGKTKEDNIYASSHSIASGLIGFIVALAITMPFKKGSDYVRKEMMNQFSAEKIKKIFPHVDVESIWQDKAKKLIKPMKEWKTIDNLQFKDLSNIDMLTEFKQMADLSELTYKEILKLNVDWAAHKGKSFNDVVTKDGKKIYDVIDMSKLGIKVKEDGMKEAQILLQDIDKDFLAGVIKDAKGTNWGRLDINSVYKDAEGKVVNDFRLWKDVDGKQWKLDLDEIYVCSPVEEISHLPRISGKKRYDVKDDEVKYITYLDNGKDGKRGTEVTEEFVEAALRNETLFRMMTWAPDILTRVPVAATTIALIPWVLKKVFGIEKGAKKQAVKADANQNVTEKADKVMANKDNPNFKGAKPNPEEASWITKQIARICKPILGNDIVYKVSNWLSRQWGKPTQHLMTLGSFITSGVYMNRTLNNKNLDKERRRTLAINQLLCLIIPTIAAYSVDKVINKHVKNFEYRVTSKMNYAKKIAEITKKEVPNFAKNPGNAKGFRIISSIGVFALIYRYLTPVLITPCANKIGEHLNAKKAKQEADAKKAA